MRSTPTLRGMDRDRWIVVGRDFSDGAQRALEHAIRLARSSGARVAVVHAYEDTAEATRAMEDRAPLLTTQLQEAVAGTNASRHGVHVESFLRRGAPWEKLQNVAVEVGADLIVVGATGQRGVDARCPLGKRCLSSRRIVDSVGAHQSSAARPRSFREPYE